MSSSAATVSLYLRPLGVLHGDAVSEAIDAGWALPLAGGRAAFTACEMWRRAGGRIECASSAGGRA